MKKSTISLFVISVIIAVTVSVLIQFSEDRFVSCKEGYKTVDNECVAITQQNKSMENKLMMQNKQKLNINMQCKGVSLCLAEKVTRIIDGDTIYLGDYKVRLSLTNTPERSQPGYLDATRFTAESCPVGSRILVDQDDMQPYDKYGRLLGKVICDNKILNAELLYNGHANVLTQYCTTSEFAGEKWAQEFGCKEINP